MSVHTLWLIFLDASYMFGCRMFTDQVPSHSTPDGNAAKPPEAFYTTNIAILSDVLGMFAMQIKC